MSTYLLNHFVSLGADGGVEDFGICSHQVNEQTQVPLLFTGEAERTHVASLQSLRFNDPTGV